MIDSLAEAVLALPLPRGSALHLVAVGHASAADLPAGIRAAAPRRRNSFAAGRQAAIAALRAAGASDSVPPGIGADGLPVWPAGWLGSISHTDVIAAAIVAPAHNAAVLGLDLERMMPAALAAEIAAEVVPESAPGRTAMAREVEVTRAFSAKEALYKALYPQTRQFRDFSAARIGWSGGENGLPAAHLTLTECWGSSWPAGTVLNARQAIAADHVLTVVWR